ncbi:MAG TPA: outer membrane protein assembly factor BamE [Rhodoblastus sp.]|nr:outer membrane protein assembly factor BamE [Rhodoblastus sp.]
MALGDKRRFLTPARLALVVALAVPLGACSTGGLPGLSYDGVVQRGYQADAATMNQLKNGLSKEKTLALLGTPSTTSTVGGDAWYYVSQTVSRPVAFMPQNVTDQRVLAVYFGKGGIVRIANYGLQDGKLFDYVSRTTPTAGGDESFVQNMIKGLLKFS